MTLKAFAGAAPQTRLMAAISDTELSIRVAAGSGYPVGLTPFVIQIGNEKILCLSRVGDTITVHASGRGYDSTEPTSHSVNDAVTHVLDSVTLTEIVDHVNDVGDGHPQYLDEDEHDSPTRHVIGAAITAGTVLPLEVGSTVREGTSGHLARADHTHAVETVAPATLEPGSNVEGVSGALSRANHRHALVTATAVQPLKTAAAGTSTALARADHGHRRQVISTYHPGNIDLPFPFPDEPADVLPHQNASVLEEWEQWLTVYEFTIPSYVYSIPNPGAPFLAQGMVMGSIHNQDSQPCTAEVSLRLSTDGGSTFRIAHHASMPVTVPPGELRPFMQLLNAQGEFEATGDIYLGIFIRTTGDVTPSSIGYSNGSYLFWLFLEPGLDRFILGRSRLGEGRLA